MNESARNARVIVYLVTSMSLGAATLYALEPARPEYEAPPGASTTVERVRIEYIPTDVKVEQAAYDCLIFDSGAHVGKPVGSQVRLGVVAGDAGEVSDAQKTKLLAILASIVGGRGLDPTQVVQLAPESDARFNPHLPDPARELGSMLVRKGLVQ